MTLLKPLAMTLAAVTAIYSAVWMYHARVGEKIEIGGEFHYERLAPHLLVTRVTAESAADRAGVAVGDRIEAVNGRPVQDPELLYRTIVRGRPGDPVRVEVARPDGPRAILGWRLDMRRPHTTSLAHRIAHELVNSFPLPFLVVAVGVLFLRWDQRDAWLLALILASFIAGPPVIQQEWLMPRALRGFVAAYRTAFHGLAPALLYYFCSVFPAPSPIERRAPWLKKAIVAAAAVVFIPLGLAALLMHGSRPVQLLVALVGSHAMSAMTGIYFVGGGALALASLVWNYVQAPTREARRKSAVIVWGVVVGFTPLLALLAASNYSGTPIDRFPFWLWVTPVLLASVIPLSFGYAVVKQQVLEIPVLLKRSARYLLVQRGLIILEFAAMLAATLTFVAIVSWLIQPRPEIAVPAGLLVGVGFGLLLASASTQVEQRITERIDRAFFRSAYDARQILEDLAQKSRRATNRQELAALLEISIKQALLPTRMAVYLDSGDGRLIAEAGTVPAGMEVVALTVQTARDAMAQLIPLQADYVVPLLGRNLERSAPVGERLLGFIVLGPRMSDEPYSREDKRLLRSVAGQAALAHESILLAEHIAGRMEQERRTAREMEIAMAVQDRLFPQQSPALETLDYSGRCIQARAVGGDYYDFVGLGPGRVGLVLADICGKGIGAALLMANLQAHLRSQYALASDDLPGMLRSVNRLFHGSTPSNAFATLFFGHYDDVARLFRYANCGHNAPLLLRSGGDVEWLTATATVLGLFPKWECAVGEVRLEPNDTLVIYSDGLPDASNDQGEQFGDERLVETVCRHRRLSASGLLDALVTTVQQFTGREREDDLTLLVARAK